MKVEMLALGAIVPYGKNPRRNAKAVDAVAASIKQFGWRQPIVVDAEKVIIVGHTRYLAAQKLGIEKVPVVVAKDLRPEQVKAYRIADNKTNELAEWDVGLLSEELKELSDAGWNNFSDLAFSNMEIDALLSPLAAETFTPERPTLASAAEEQSTAEGNDKEPGALQENQVQRNYIEDEIEDDEEPLPEDNSILAYREDAIFTTSNRWGFPDLLEHMLWDGDIKGVYTIDGDISPTRIVHWGTIGFDERMKDHAIAFYSEDERFEAAVWEKAIQFIDKLKVVRPAALIQPDFSIWKDDPPAVQIWNTYRSRWCARYWQEAGWKIIPNISFADEQTWEWIFDGIPKQIPCAAIQARTSGGSDKAKQRFLLGLRKFCERVEVGKVFVYGGEHRKWIEPAIPSGPKFVWIDSFHKARKEMGKC
jgi:ParB-like chromosome segregation protein Spo0J